MKTIEKLKKVSICFLIMFFSLFNFYNLQVQAADDAEDIEKKLDKTQEQLEAEQRELENSQNLLQKNQLQVNTTQGTIRNAELEVSRKETEIDNLNSRIELNKNLLEQYLQEIYIADQGDFLLADFILNESDFNDTTENLDNIISVKEKILSVLGDIKDSKGKIVEVKEELEEKKKDYEKILSQKKSEQVEIKGDIQESQATIAELNAKINKLKGQLSDLLGSAVSFKDITDAASFASKATGVRKDFLLGMLVVESDLGRYTGGCNFKESKMSGNRAEIFKDICKELNYNYKTKKVSCPPKSYKGTGGAMGVAQFMPDTWIGYKSSVASKTGHNPPDPWSLTDGVVAMALKLAKGGATSKSGECNAAKLYLSGTTSKTYNWYCDRVAYWADNYEKKLE